MLSITRSNESKFLDSLLKVAGLDIKKMYKFFDTVADKLFELIDSADDSYDLTKQLDKLKSQMKTIKTKADLDKFCDKMVKNFDALLSSSDDSHDMILVIDKFKDNVSKIL